MAAEPAVIVIHETTRIEHVPIDTGDGLSWLRRTLGADTVDRIQLGMQIWLYYDPSSTRAGNSLADKIIRAYPAAPKRDVRGPVVMCRYDQRYDAVHNLFVAQIDHLVERFGCHEQLAPPVGGALEAASPGELEREPVTILTHAADSDEAQYVRMPVNDPEAWIQAKLGIPLDRLEIVRLEPGMVLLHDPRSRDDRNFIAEYVCATLIPTRRVFVRGAALICGMDPETGRLGDIGPDQIERMLTRYSRVVLDRLASVLAPLFYRLGIYLEIDRPQQGFGFRFDNDGLGLRSAGTPSRPSGPVAPTKPLLPRGHVPASVWRRYSGA